MERNKRYTPKTKGFFSVGIKVKLGDFSTDQARELASIIKTFGADELRFTLRQNILIRHIPESNIIHVYNELLRIGLVDYGYESLADITACPGTDTCNLGIASSTGIASELEKVLFSEFPSYASNKDLTIKISGCMNACGQHNMAHIGFQGMSLKTEDKRVAPAVQVLLGGGVLGNGKGRFADKVIKLPSKRGPEALRRLIKDFETNKSENESFLDYYDRLTKNYFYKLLSPLSNADNLVESDFIDWGNFSKYIQAVGVGECAGVVIDLVATLILEAEEKYYEAEEAFRLDKYADSIHLAYSSMINIAKAMLTSEEINVNTQAKVVDAFDEHFIASGKINLKSSFSNVVYQIRANKPSGTFNEIYLKTAKQIISLAKDYREQKFKNE